MSEIDTEIAVVGAGLSGLAVADALVRHGLDVTVIEARGRVGGRILSLPGGGEPFDLGPAWVWPHNARMLALIARLGLAVGPQYGTGNLVFQDADGAVRRDLSFSTMAGALRVTGGLAGVAERLATGLPEAAVRLGCEVTGLRAAGGCVEVGMHDSVVRARRVVLALPPRLLAKVRFDPPLSADTHARLSAVPTWMAGHAKVVAVYGSAFWRDQGLSGDAICHRGPVFEIHDASSGRAGALFGFANPGWARGDLAGFERAAIAQLVELFGAQAGAPAQVFVKDWADDPHTAMPADATLPNGHPTYRPLELGAPNWAGRVVLSGTETAGGEGGFLEGALEAAERAVAEVLA